MRARGTLAEITGIVAHADDRVGDSAAPSRRYYVRFTDGVVMWIHEGQFILDPRTYNVFLPRYLRERGLEPANARVASLLRAAGAL